MSFLSEQTPKFLEYLYKAIGIIQFSTDKTKPPTTPWPLTWSLPFTCYILYAYCTSQLMNFVDYSHIRGDLFFTYIEIFSANCAFLAVLINTYHFNKRRHRLRAVLIDLHAMHTSPSASIPHFGLMRNISFCLMGAAFATALPENPTVHHASTLLIAPCASHLNHAFLADIVNRLHGEFEAINEQLRRQVDAVDLGELFPLTKRETLAALKRSEKLANLEQVESLSHRHYDLVQLGQQIDAIFSITTLAATMLIFTNIIIIIYLLLYGIAVEISRYTFFIDYACMLLMMLFWMFSTIRSLSVIVLLQFKI